MSKTRRIVIAIAIALAFILIAFCIYSLTMSNKSKMINILYNYFSDNLDMESENVQSFKVSTNTVVDLKTDGVSSKYDISGDLYKGKSKNEMYAKLITKFNTFALNLEILGTNDAMYFKLKEAKDVFYKIIGNKNSIQEYSENDYKEFLNVLKSAFNDSFKEKDFSKAKDTIPVGNSKIKTSKYTMTLKYQSLYNIVENLFKNVDKSKILKDTIASLNNNNKNADYLKELKDTIEGKETNEVFNYSIFVKEKNDIVKHLFQIPVSLGDTTEKTNMKFSILSAESDDGLDVLDVSIDMAEFPIASFSIKETVKDKYDINGNVTGLDTLIKGTAEVDKEKINLNIVATTSDGLKPFELIINTSDGSSDEEYNFDLTLNTTLGVNIISKNIVTLGATMPSVDVSNAINYDEMTSAESQIFEKIFDSLK